MLPGRVAEELEVLLREAGHARVRDLVGTIRDGRESRPGTPTGDDGPRRPAAPRSEAPLGR